ncbi:MAG: hypothetical protein ACK44W_15500 [Planctomycetota bacterium]
MAGAAKEKGGTSAATLAAAGAVVLFLAGGVLWIRREADRARAEFERALAEYREMATMKRALEEAKRRGPRPPSPGTEDLLQFLDKKRAQAGIPQGSFTIEGKQDLSPRGWRETAYRVAIRGQKDAPVPRAPVVEFLRLLEEERPTVKTKGLTLVFSGEAFSSVTLTLSSFQRDEAPASR